MPWHPTGVAANGIDRSPRPMSIAGDDLLLVPFGDRWHAIEDRCSHAGCRFSEDGEIDGFYVICDCHGSEFDVRDGSVLAGPAVVPIASFPVREQDGFLEVEL
jgi:nitrite reductase/ring-hydroxylating ferredoxin subunit